MPSPYPLEPSDPERIGDYRVAARLGAGGQGVVFLCTTPNGRKVAIKHLHSGFSGTARDRQQFRREVKAANRVKAYAARVLATGEHAGRPYIVSEFIAGESVQDRVHREGPYGLPELLTLASGTASALAAIHATGLVHCDFKPANILAGPDGVRVVDFGIARALDTIAHRTPELQGTPAFMAPEQINGGPMGPHTDVFAWAGAMVFAATGEPPFGSNDGHGVMHRIVNDEPDLDGVPEPLREIVSACLLKKPTKRPSASDVLSMLGGRAASSPLPTGAQIGDPLTGHARTITCVAYGLAGDRPVAVTGGHDRTARVWDLSAHQHLGPPLRHDAAVLAVACGRLADRPIALTGCQDHTLNLWDLESGTRIGAPLRGHTGAVVSIALGMLDGDPVAVSVSDDRSVRLWDLTEHRQIGPPLVENNSVMSVACGELDGHAVAVIGGAWDQSVRILDLDSRRPTGLPLTGHTNSVMSVDCGTLADRPIAITGGYDRTVRVWDLTTHQETDLSLVHRSAVMSVAFGMRGGRPTELTSGADRAVRVWDLTTGEQVGEPLTAGPSLAGSAVPITFGELAGDPIAITCHEDLAIRLWSLGTS
ncbi:MAG: WD40 repeat domain-containing serine/threonine protein kinase [Actinomadura sp.]